nr:hypothetical protein [Veillonella parvula]
MTACIKPPVGVCAWQSSYGHCCKHYESWDKAVQSPQAKQDRDRKKYRQRD